MKKRLVAVLLAAFLMLPLYSTVAYAGGGDPEQEPPEPAPTEEVAQNPLTPNGTGTVVDHVTDEDGKEFYTIVTADGNIFYLIIDHQRGSQNVYFLNAVTEEDLLALAEPSESVSSVPAPEPTPAPAPTPEPNPQQENEPEPEKSSGFGSILLIIVLLAAGGGAYYYFKILRPKQQGGNEADFEDDYGYEEDNIYGSDDETPWPDDEDAPPWDEEAENYGDADYEDSEGDDQ